MYGVNRVKGYSDCHIGDKSGGSPIGIKIIMIIIYYVQRSKLYERNSTSIFLFN
jgi:hypothetical protein